VYLDNLVDALRFVCRAPGAAGRTLSVRDDEDRSVAQWIAAIRAARGRPTGLWLIPPSVMRAALTVAGRASARARLCRPAQLDDRALRALGWRPPVGFAEALAATLRWHDERDA
jgi:nucleoside-diphosphate-sugar epimerase